VDRHTAGPDTRMFEHVFESTARFDDCHVLCLRTSVTVPVVLVVTLGPQARAVAVHEPIDPRVRLAIAQWPDDAPPE
uniref:hypothetical protein n=1 Tax=Mycolicibacterium mucogenicum TaxID=56689 RepID=UPI00194F3DD3